MGIVLALAGLVLSTIVSAAFLLPTDDYGAENENASNETSIPLILVEPVVVSDAKIKLQKPFSESIISGFSDFPGINVLSSNNSFLLAI